MKLPLRPVAFGLLLAASYFVALRPARAEEPAAPVSLSGHWEGTWQDCLTGHDGPLQADFCRLDETCYEVEFRGRFFKVIPFRYSVVLRVVGEEDDKLLLAGSSDLGRRQGTFHYHAEATDCCFTAWYKSCKYQGRFDLKRCTRCCP